MLWITSAWALTLETDDRTLGEGLPELFEAGEACAGVAPAVAEPLVVERVTAKGNSGTVVATVDDEGRLTRLDVGSGVGLSEVAVGVAGTFFERGDHLVWFGRSTVLARCMLGHTGGALPLYMADLDEMPELMAWDGQDLDTLASAREGALRLFLALEQDLGAETVYGLGRWEEVDAQLGSASPIRALAGSAEAQREALSDPDHDGWPSLYEELRGWDPQAWDSDGDGWWDGAPEGIPEGAVLLPRDGSAICLERIPAEAEHVTLTYGGQLRGTPVHGKVRHGFRVAAPLLESRDWQRRPGGVYAVVSGEGLVDNPACALSEGLTVRDETKRYPKLNAALVEPMQAAMAALDELLGPSPDRLNVTLVDTATPYVRRSQVNPESGLPAVEIPVGLGNEARKKERLDLVAAQAAALFRMAEVERLADPGAAAAWGHWLTGHKVPNTPALNATRSEVKAWLKRVEACGWEELRDRPCT